MEASYLDPCRIDLGQRLFEALKSSFDQTPPNSGLELAGFLEKPPNQDLGDYAFPCFRLAKGLRKKPADIANVLAERLNQMPKVADSWFESASTAGAFLNFTTAKQQLASHTIESLENGAYFTELSRAFPDRAQKKVMIEYSQPNTHKLFHVGHLRNVCLGNSLVRLNEYGGYPVVAVNYIGDEGAHIAECLWHMKREGSKPPEANDERVQWLEGHYAAAKEFLAENKDDAAEARHQIGAILKELESGKGSDHAKWVETKAWCMDEFSRIYDWLGARFDHIFFESEMTQEAQAIVEKYHASGVFKLDDGAIGIDLEEDGLGFLILRKTDGSTLYATKDLALAARKFERYEVQKSIYVVAAEQNLHFKQVFKTLEHMGFERATDCFHLSYGFVRIPGGKMSTRKGNAIHFKLLQEALTEELSVELRKNRSDWAEEELAEAQHRLAVAAIMYGMLKTDPVKEIIFDLKQWVSFEGDTGPYLLYSYARVSSILAKIPGEAKAEGLAAQVELLTEATEHRLLRYMYDLNESIEAARSNYRPSSLASHLFQMCKELNRLYAAVRVNDPDHPEQTQARARLLRAFQRSLKQGLDLLGMPTVDRM